MNETDKEAPLIAYKRTNLRQIKELPNVHGRVYENVESLKTLGFEASNVYRAYELWSKAIKENYKIVLGFTSNAISCGLRDIIANLCRAKLVDLIFTTGGGIEEDVMKSVIPAKLCLKPASDSNLYEAGINRTQNLYFTNDSYVFFESFLKQLYEEYPSLKNTTVKQLIKQIGKKTECPSSFLHWCYVNQIPVLAGGVEDCAIGDYLAIQNFKVKNDITKEIILNCAYTLTDYLDFLYQDNRKVLVVILGGGFVKHMIMNGCIARGGADSAIYMNNEPFYTGSNCGAPISEAISWGKLKSSGFSESVKVHGDYLLPFYLVASEILKKANRS